MTVSAGSQPPGATVTGGGAMLGRTPFAAQVPVPRPAPGETQTFEFTFQLPGYQTQTITASPVNNTLTLNVLLVPDAPVVAATPDAGETVVATPGAHGREFTVRGVGGGAIVDNSRVTGTAQVADNCVIGDLAVTLQGAHTYFSDLTITLTGPDGERYSIQRQQRANPFTRHRVRRATGHASGGTWQLVVADTVRADSGQLRGWSLDFTCQ